MRFGKNGHPRLVPSECPHCGEKTGRVKKPEGTVYVQHYVRGERCEGSGRPALERRKTYLKPRGAA